jgi:CDP-4-dehydro-6-deoxyglucose reductase, E3
MLDLIQQWSDQLSNFQFTPILSEPTPSTSDSDFWNGKTGYIHEGVIEAYDDLSSFDIYMCGPPIMINASRKALLSKGVNENNIFT